MSNPDNVFRQVVIALLVLVLGGAGLAAIMMLRSPAKRKPTHAAAQLVQTAPLSLYGGPARLRTTGIVRAAKEVTVVPEVGGRLRFVSEQMIPGGRFKKGDILARIDAREYSMLIKQEESRVRRAELELQLEAGRQKTAKREWALLGEGKGPDLALRKPHLAAAKYSLDAAQSGLDRARLNLERTVLRAPFNSIVATEHVEEGQVVGPGTQVARLVGTDALWVDVAVPVGRLSLVQIPGVGGDARSSAMVRQVMERGRTVERVAEVLRLQGTLDSATRTARVLVEVKSPFDADRFPLLPGAHVEVDIEGRSFPDVFAIPRSAIYEGNVVFTVVDNKLQRHEVELRWGDPKTAYVATTKAPRLVAGNRLVISPVALPVDGIAVRTQGDGP